MKKSNLTGVLVLLVFAVFMVSVLLVLLSGADTVQKLTDRDQRTYHHRTAVQYLTTRIRQSDIAGAVTTDNSGVSTLILTETVEGQLYETRIYCYEGYLREMFCPAGLGLPEEFGEEILPMDDFQVTLEDNILRAELVLTDGTSEHCSLLLRSEGGLSHEE